MNEANHTPEADAGPVRHDVGRPAPERAGLMKQIEACRREVAGWPAWMRTTSRAPKWMEGWDD